MEERTIEQRTGYILLKDGTRKEISLEVETVKRENGSQDATIRVPRLGTKSAQPQKKEGEH